MWRLTLMFLFLDCIAFSQLDTNRRQVEFAGALYTYQKVLVLHGQMGVNFPTGKQGWYNNVALASGMQDFLKREGSINHMTTLSIGKNYELTGRWFYFSIGCNAGLYYYDWRSENRASRNFGICIIPRLELGWNMKQMVIAVGLYPAIGFGYYQKYIDGEIYYDDPENVVFLDKYHGASFGTPYIRLILK